MEEIWKDVVGFEGLYEVSNYGEVRSLDRTIHNFMGNRTHFIKGRILKQINQNNYLSVCLYNNGVCKPTGVHRVVATAFIPNEENKREVNHKDGNKHNNNVQNLEWVTSSENRYHAYEKGLIKLTDKAKSARSFNGKRTNIGKSKPIYQIDKQSNEVVKLWLSKRKIERETDFQYQGVNLCCNGKLNSYKGYKWDFAQAPFSKGFIFMVEGCDATGKSTLINYLQKETGFKVLKGSDFSIAEKGADFMYNHLFNIFNSDEYLILDRSFISNLVYAPMYDKNILSKYQIDNLIDIVKNKSFTIYLKGSENTIRERLENRGDDYVESKHISTILQRYEDMMSDYKKKIEIIEFDVDDCSASLISKVVLNIMKNMNLIIK